MPISIPTPQIKLGKRKENSQIAHVSTTDGRLLSEEIPVIATVAISDKHTCLFMLEHSEQYQGKDGQFIQLWSDKSMIPLMPASEEVKRDAIKKILKSTSDGVFDLTEDIAIYNNFQNANKNDRGDVIKWVVSFVMGAFVIIAAMQYLFGGH